VFICEANLNEVKDVFELKPTPKSILNGNLTE
jgi:hypothetical protein